MYGIYIMIGVLGAIWSNRRRKYLKIKVKGTDTEIRIEEKDLFEGDGLKFIPVNDLFDYELGDHVSEGSLHGQFIKRIMRNERREWRNLVDKKLEGCEEERTEDVGGGEGRKRYPIGTSIRVEKGGPGQGYMLVALSRTKRTTLKAKATVEDVCITARRICEGAREYSQGRRIEIPIIGAGLSNTGIPPQELLDILMLFIIQGTQEGEIGKDIRIVGAKDTLAKIDLNRTRERWQR